MVHVSNLSKSYGRQVVFDDVSFTLNSGEKVGLVGRNGHGKTTLLRMLLGEEQPDSGVISLPKDYRIGHLSQHIRFTEDTALKEACTGLHRPEDGRDETFRVEAILFGLGFSPDDVMRDPPDLSGGYQVRLNLARVLVSDPDLLLLDEPGNYLDILSIRWLTQFLRNWGKEMILITHDRDFMDGVTTHTMGIHRCRIRKMPGQTDKLYQQLLEEEEIHEKTRRNDEKKRQETERFINRFRAQANKAKAVQSRIKALQKKEKLGKLSEIRNLEFEFTSAPFTGKRLVEIEDLAFSFGPDVPPLVDGLSLSVGKKDRIAVIGKNGRGKTTLLSLVAGELQPLSGNITRHPDLRLAYFGQTNVERLDPSKSIEEEILDVHPCGNRGAARAICGAMMFEDDSALKKIGVLSGGEKSRVLLGKLLVTPANLLMLDEPTNHLDMESIHSLTEAIDAFDGAVVIVTHNEMVLHAVAERLVVFDGGDVRVFEGTYRDFLDRQGWKDDVEYRPSGNSGSGGLVTAPARKDVRRAKAEIIDQRSRTIGPLQKRIADVEKSIMRLEGRIDKETEVLLQASAASDAETIGKSSRSIHQAKREIEVLFTELEELTSEHDAKSKAFEQKLLEIQGIA
ncbi:MAG: ATP-binding cassette domain-containing protein [Candidatus Sulfobium sp.]|jgi:ATP-binding cassette subfamily F protein 3